MATRKTLFKDKKPLKISPRRLKQLPFSRLLPNITTLMSLSVGLSAIRFAMIERYEMAVIAILLAAILDMMDGRLARMLGVDSHFGAELDSLSDFASFGVAPALVLYVSALHTWNGFGWALCLFYIMCAALRLARFNTLMLQKKEIPLWATSYFVGMPSPAGAFMALLPIVFSFAMEQNYSWLPYAYGASLLIAGALMVSRVRTYSSKGVHISRSQVVPLFVGIGVCITALINAFWFTLFIAGVVYLGSIYFSHQAFKRREKSESEELVL